MSLPLVDKCAPPKVLDSRKLSDNQFSEVRLPWTSYAPVTHTAVHIDQTPKAGENRVIALLGESEGQKALKKRVQIINIWRPLRGPVVDSPLGMIDTRSIDWERDVVVGEILYRDR